MANNEVNRKNVTNQIDEDRRLKKEKYYHPYQPYKIQLELMKEIYDTLKDDTYKVGIFESPTGTGKTLSLICSTLTWIRENKYKNLHEGNTNLNDNDPNEKEDDEPDWVTKAFKESILKEKKALIDDYETHLDGLVDSSAFLYNELSEAPSINNSYDISDLMATENYRRFKKKKIEVSIDSDDEFLPNDYNVDGIAENEKISSEIRKMITNLESKMEREETQDKFDKLKNSFINDLNDNQPVPKIYFASRTHSQLSQFSGQLSLTKFPSVLDGLEFNERVKYLPLGSRKQLCINTKVSKLGNTSLINEACLDLQKKDETKKSTSLNKDKTAKQNTGGCEFYINYKKDMRTTKEINSKFRDLTFSKIHDIEDLVILGKNLHICPYYSSKHIIDTIPEVISLPYQLLLSQEIRSQLNINTKNSIIIIDEAHNLIDTITSLNSVNIRFEELKEIETNLKAYYSRFMKKLNSGNRINLLKLIKLIGKLTKYVENFKSKNPKIESGLNLNINDIFFNNDLINIYDLDNYLKNSKIAYKIEKFTNSKIPLLFKLIQLLKLINNPSKDGKLFFNDDFSLNYMLLNPIEAFKDLVVESKCVILCGGTMEPIEDFEEFLFPYLNPKKQIKKFNCEHIIPDANLKVIPISNYKNTVFDFSFKKRNNQKLIENLGNLILSLAVKIPHGVVVFFPSYKYLNDLIINWKNVGIWDMINKAKKVFCEPKGKIENFLEEYNKYVHSENNGAILFSVVGGKISEGINFNDELARAVFMIGLPYPNVYSGELINKRKYIEEQVIQKGRSLNDAKMKSQEFYENLCMKAVNQSIGRSIRNINDYSIIYLIDYRFNSEKVKGKLSGWIKKRIEICRTIDDVFNQTERFFHYHSHKEK